MPRALGGRWVPVPAVLGVERSDDVLGQPFFVMDFVRGSSELTGHALQNYLRELHTVHRLDPTVARGALGPVPEDWQHTWRRSGAGR